MTDNAKKGILMGKNKILLFRKLKDASEEDATKLLYQTSHAFSFERDADSVVTKDGTVVKLGDLEGEVSSIEAVQAKEDDVADMLYDAMLDGEKLEIWEVAVDEDLEEDEKFPAIYAQGFLTSWEAEAEAEDEATYSGDFMVELIPQFGMTALPEGFDKDDVQYEFKELEAEGD